jgi:hypothetical protein
MCGTLTFCRASLGIDILGVIRRAFDGGVKEGYSRGGRDCESVTETFRSRSNIDSNCLERDCSRSIVRRKQWR